LTPEQAYGNRKTFLQQLRQAQPLRARDPAPELHVIKRDYGACPPWRGDPHLPVIEISFDEDRREAA
jgi:hypothetical protein